MKIAFATTLSFKQSTMIGRVIPLAEYFAQHNSVHVLHLDKTPKRAHVFKAHRVGKLPFTITPQGKERLRGLPLVLNLKLTALRTCWTLWRLKPDVIIIVKPLPHNVAGVTCARWLSLKKPKTILDVDDFELTANKLTSLAQRAGIHWAERQATKLARVIVVASPFLEDRYRHLASKLRTPPEIVMIPTGISESSRANSYEPAWRKASLRDHPAQAGLTRGELVSGDASGERVPRLAYLGSLSISSGHRVDLLPEILTAVKKRSPEATLLIAGTGDDRRQIERAFAKSGLGSSVTWHGHFSLDEIEKLLSETTILIDPIDTSITQRAKSSFRVMLAGFAGLPIVTSNVGIRPRLLPRQLHERFFAKPSDRESYAEKIVDLITHPLNPADIAEMRQLAQNYTWDKLGAAYLSYINP